MKLFSHLSSPDLSIEEIAMQHEDKYLELEDKVSDFLENIRTERKCKGINQFNSHILQSVCEDLFGISLICKCDPNGSFGIMTPDSPNSLSIANYTHYKEAVSDYVNGGDTKKVDKVIKDFNKKLPTHGSVDLKNARLTGGFKNARAKLIYGGDFVNNAKFTVKEMTAVLLHELGHVFNEYLYSSQINDYNTMLQSHSAEWKKLPPEEVAFKVLKNDPVRRGFLTEDQATQIEQAEEPLLPADIAVMMYTTKASHILGETAQHRSAEVLADGFSSRCGYGAPLVTALDKLGDKWSFGRTITQGVFWVVVMLLFITLSGFSFLSGLFLAFSVMTMISTFGMAAFRFNYFSYPDDRSRVENILHLTIQRLRTTRGAHAKKMLKDVAIIQKLMESYPNNYGFWSYMMGSRVDMHLADIQRLMHNKLFITAITLKLTASI